MAVVVPHTQEFTLAWTPPPTGVASSTKSMKRAAKNGSPVEKNDSKRRRRGDKAPVLESVKVVPDEASHSEDSYDQRNEADTPSENHSQAANEGDEYKWPSLSRKRQRMTEDERKARHREVQRQFMQRKLAKLDDMRKLMVVLEKQYLILQLSQERARLEHENDYLHRRVLANPPHWKHEHPHEQQQRLRNAPPPPPLHPSSHPHHTAQGHRAPTGMLPWDEILEAVSEAANV